MVAQEGLPLMTRELAAVIGVRRHRRYGLAAPQGHQQRASTRLVSIRLAIDQSYAVNEPRP
jgi:hypothetical protein